MFTLKVYKHSLSSYSFEELLFLAFYYDFFKQYIFCSYSSFPNPPRLFPSPYPVNFIVFFSFFLSKTKQNQNSLNNNKPQNGKSKNQNKQTNKTNKTTSPPPTTKNNPQTLTKAHKPHGVEYKGVRRTGPVRGDSKETVSQT